MNTIVTGFKAFRKLKGIFLSFFYTPIAKIIFFLNGAQIDQGLHVNGLIKVLITRRGRMKVGRNLRLNSGDNSNIIGRQQKCIFWVEGKLSIGNNAGMSSTAIICKHEITIGNHVMIGGNTVIYDTDFHSLNPLLRNSPADAINAKHGPVIIKDNVFIGAHTTIIKNITIGENAVIGACSVVCSNIPDNEIWAGNPARFIRSLDNEL